MDVNERAIGCLLGLAIGDAIGTTLEFQRPGTFTPIDDMVGGGPFNLLPGEWTDDTSMALCLADSLLHCNGFDAEDQIQRYVRWWRTGYRSVTGQCFDIGNTVRRALQHYEYSREPFAGPTEPSSAGNGSLMRLAPVVIYFSHDREQCVHYAQQSSRTTHSAKLAVEACGLFAAMLQVALRGDVSRVLTDHGFAPDTPELQDVLANVAVADSRPATSVRGTGYCVDALEAALWCFATTSSYARRGGRQSRDRVECLASTRRRHGKRGCTTLGADSDGALAAPNCTHALAAVPNGSLVPPVTPAVTLALVRAFAFGLRGAFTRPVVSADRSSS